MWGSQLNSRNCLSRTFYDEKYLKSFQTLRHKTWMWNEMRIILLNFASVCKREKVYLFRNGNWKSNLEIEVMSRSSTCLKSRADYYNRSWKWANMPFFKDTYFLLRKVFKVSIGQKVQQFAELPSDRPVQHFLSDPCAHGVRSLGRNVCPSVTEFVKT